MAARGAGRPPPLPSDPHRPPAVADLDDGPRRCARGGERGRTAEAVGILGDYPLLDAAALLGGRGAQSARPAAGDCLYTPPTGRTRSSPPRRRSRSPPSPRRGSRRGGRAPAGFERRLVASPLAASAPRPAAPRCSSPRSCTHARPSSTERRAPSSPTSTRRASRQSTARCTAWRPAPRRSRTASLPTTGVPTRCRPMRLSATRRCGGASARSARPSLTCSSRPMKPPVGVASRQASPLNSPLTTSKSSQDGPAAPWPGGCCDS